MADQSTATTTTSSTSTEAHEVKSVREQVEEMGVEKMHSPGSSSSKSKDLPASWDAYADLQSPFACFAPQTTTWSFAQSSEQADQGEEPFNPQPARALAPPSTSIPPAFSLTGQQTQTNSLCPNKFPSGSDFFLKGKRNTTSLADSSPELDQDSASLHKKPKLPPPTATTTSSSCPSPASSSAAKRLSPTSLRSAALEKFNNNPALQTPSMQSSTVTSFLHVHPPSSKASSAIADNGETDEQQQQPSSTTRSPANPSPQPDKVVPVQSALGFSAFATATGFGGTGSSTTKPTIDWSNGQPSLFDQQHPSSSSSSSDTKPLDQITTSARSDWGNTALSSTPNTGIKRKTHLALDAGLADEDKHEGFLATEVITGEENEELIKTVRCKMFTLGEDQSWRERGTGGLRLLRSKDEPSRYRLIMRADAVLRVLLNVPIFNGFSYRPSQDKFLTFGSTVVLDATSSSSTVTEGEEVGTGEGGNKTQFQQYLCRFGKPEARQEMIDSIEECLKDIHCFHAKSSPENHHQDDDQESALDASNLV
ncbi:hypothetical protein MJO28_011076 [Puccinia striiformis f. sp. tritici]|uniref:Uncharacterized protein n=1 Tax=Puccinia striiformis f. sp. tritici TaxID=168172 RepID=A0ACC0E320_9BASI|nr:hypothetical protein MJO28_011076 [Puccinia striiformis f. sp. tritici]